MTQTQSLAVSEIAAKLTEAQRRAVFCLSGQWVDDRSSDHLVRALCNDEAIKLQPQLIEYRKKKINDWITAHMHRLTALGLEVRAILEGKTNG